MNHEFGKSWCGFKSKGYGDMNLRFRYIPSIYQLPAMIYKMKWDLVMEIWEI